MADSKESIEEFLARGGTLVNETTSVGLDDPYLELFDRINQLEMEVKELQELVKILKPSTFQWSQWPMGKQGEYQEVSQAEFKFFK